MIYLMWLANIFFAMSCTAEKTKWMGFTLAGISGICYMVADAEYKKLKDRIKKLEMEENQDDAW